MLRTSVLLVILLISASLLATSVTALGEQRMISIGDRRLAVYCAGEPTRSPTVVLIPAGGRTAQDWDQVHPGVSTFTRVCSFDHANVGDSDKAPVNLKAPVNSQKAPLKLQSVDEHVDDLYAWLKAAGEKGPFILASHSISGFYVRRFVARFPSEVAGLVFVDSSHEEQALRLHQVDSEGPAPDALTAWLGFYVEPGQQLDWQTELPLIVLGRGMPFPRKARDGSDSQTNRMSEEQWAAWDRTWREFQEDLANRSTKGQFRLAEKSGHFIQRDQPELVIQAIRDVSRMR